MRTVFADLGDTRISPKKSLAVVAQVFQCPEE